MRIEENKVVEYECPKIILSKKEEKRIANPWKKGVIVKMFGRRVGSKALENGLQKL